ncbi:FecR domain-containing protein [Catenovulum maritimum]|uniref:FecR domain-containing protein n=1 Tax=Catenovulum maritimum TaxID=1513271 RepID=UPI0006600DA7|nr:FecR domain-containing protein [Catenovulum maritimum]
MFQSSQSRREFLLKTLIAGGYGFTAGSALLAPLVHALGKVPRQLTSDESIFKLSGKVKVNGQYASEKTIVTANSTIETDSNSQLIFVVGKDAHIVRENSKVILSGSSDKVETGLQLTKGKILSVFGERQGTEKHQIKTTTATIGIRGTGVYAESEDDHSYVCTCYGQTKIASASHPATSEVITSKHHDAARYIFADSQGGQIITEAPMKNHEDEELMLIEALVGRTTPFSSLMGYSDLRKKY